MAQISTVTGTSGNDVLDVHRGDMYQAGRLVVMASGSFADGVPPIIQLRVNGQVVVGYTPIWATSWSGKSQEISYTIPAGTVVQSVAVEYMNDVFKSNTEDRNVYLNSVTLNGVELALSAGTYTPEARPVQPGDRLVAWNGPLTWSGPVVSSAMNADTYTASLTVHSGEGMDTVIYGGRATNYNVSFSGFNMIVASKANAFGPDTLTGTERLLFDDRGVLYNGMAAQVSRNGNNVVIDGGTGIDTVVFNGARSEYTISNNGNGNFTITRGPVSDVLVNVERLIFTDTKVALDVNGNAGQAYRLYQAAFDRTPDVGGLGFQMNDLDNNLMLWQVAKNFLDSPEFQATYGNLSNQQYVEQLYRNVLNREGEQAGINYHVNNLNNGLGRHDLLAQFSESPENQANVIGTIGNGMVYTF